MFLFIFWTFKLQTFVDFMDLLVGNTTQSVQKVLSSYVAYSSLQQPNLKSLRLTPKKRKTKTFRSC